MDYISESKGLNIFEENMCRQYGCRCPKCGSTNIYNRPDFSQWFWGCYDCKFGFWEQYLTKSIILKYKWIEDLKDNSSYFTVLVIPYVNTIEYKNKKKAAMLKAKKDDEQQLSLF